MSQQTVIGALNRLMANQCHSLVDYVSESPPWTHPGNEKLPDATRGIVADYEHHSQLLAGGVAKITVGGATQMEVKEKKMRIRCRRKGLVIDKFAKCWINRNQKLDDDSLHMIQVHRFHDEGQTNCVLYGARIDKTKLQGWMWKLGDHKGKYYESTGHLAIFSLDVSD